MAIAAFHRGCDFFMGEFRIGQILMAGDAIQLSVNRFGKNIAVNKKENFLAIAQFAQRAVIVAGETVSGGLGQGAGSAETDAKAEEKTSHTFCRTRKRSW
jgi:hypothetical protein